LSTPHAVADASFVVTRHRERVLLAMGHRRCGVLDAPPLPPPLEKPNGVVGTSRTLHRQRRIANKTPYRRRVTTNDASGTASGVDNALV